MDNIFILLAVGFMVGTAGTIIGAGGGFILVPVLLFTHPELPPDIVTAISIAIVASNAISGSIAYARSRRIDYRAGILFALFTIPGSILGVYTTAYIPKATFHIIFGILMIVLSLLLFFANKENTHAVEGIPESNKFRSVRYLEDAGGIKYSYYYNPYMGIFISVIVGYLSPLLGIGGGIIHVPSLIHWLNFPVYVATATSHFILAVMATVSVITHFFNGNYNDPLVQRMVLFLCGGAIAGAQLGAFISHRIKGRSIIRVLAVCLAIVGLRILMDVHLPDP